MANAYGNGFTSQYGDVPNETWAAGLSPYPVEQIMAAVGKLVSEGREFPPNLSVLIATIQGGTEDRFIQGQQALQSRPASEVLGENQLEDLSAKEAKKQERIKGLADLKALLS